jgi:hypothetical protein
MEPVALHANRNSNELTLTRDNPLRRLSVQDSRRDSEVLNRLRSKQTQLIELVSTLREEEPSGNACLNIVRYFNLDEEDDKAHMAPEFVTLPSGLKLERVTGHYSLLGWHLDGRDLDFLNFVGADIDVDEYE